MPYQPWLWVMNLELLVFTTEEEKISSIIFLFFSFSSSTHVSPFFQCDLKTGRHIFPLSSHYKTKSCLQTHHLWLEGWRSNLVLVRDWSWRQSKPSPSKLLDCWSCCQCMYVSHCITTLHHLTTQGEKKSTLCLGCTAGQALMPATIGPAKSSS